MSCLTFPVVLFSRLGEGKKEGGRTEGTREEGGERLRGEESGGELKGEGRGKSFIYFFPSWFLTLVLSIMSFFSSVFLCVSCNIVIRYLVYFRPFLIILVIR